MVLFFDNSHCNVKVQLMISTGMSVFSEQLWIILYEIEMWVEYITMATLVGSSSAMNESGYAVAKDLFQVRKNM